MKNQKPSRKTKDAQPGSLHMPKTIEQPKAREAVALHPLVMRCLKPGCPRTRKANRATCPDVPLKVAEIHSYCPWHEKQGWKEYPELFYDSKGRKLDSVTWDVIA